MGAPTAPTASSLISEAFNKAGYSSPSTTLTTRAAAWLEEIKADIWEKSKKLKSLQTKVLRVLTLGQGQYANPSDFAFHHQLEFATGIRYGTAQAGSVNTITLAATETASSQDLVGKEICLVSGTGLSVDGFGQISQIIAYNPTTKVATFFPVMVTNPSSDSGYVILDDYREVQERPLDHLGELTNPSEQGYPERFYPLGDTAVGKYVLYPVPFRNDTQPMVLIQRYYANLMLLDLTSSLLVLLYQNWRSVWLAGLFWKALLDADDDGAPAAEKRYLMELQKIIRMEDYHFTLTAPQATVMDY